jgi:hypothetical protein
MVIDDDLHTLLYEGDQSFRMRGSINGEDSFHLYLEGVEIPRFHPQLGWSLEFDPLTQDEEIQDRRKRIRFHNPFRHSNSLIEIDYRTIPAHCPKCNGCERNNDFRLSPKQSFLHVTDHDKLLQKVLKYLLTADCEFYPTLTSRIKNSIGQKLGLSLTEEDIESEITATLLSLIKVQSSQKSIQAVTPQELLKNLEEVSAKVSEIDPTRMVVEIRVSSYGKELPAPLRFTMRTSSR